MCKVSIIIPAYNAGKTIEKTVRSVLEQTYSDFEIIIVNDGSEDNTAEKCVELQDNDNRIKVINVSNGGVSKARNIGIKNSSGIYLVFLDSDDTMKNTMLEKMLDNYEQGFLCIVGYSRQWKKNDKIVKSKDIVWRMDEEVSIIEQSEFVDFYSRSFASSVWNKLYLKEIIAENDILFLEDLSLGEDLCFNLEYFEKSHCKFKMINQVLYNYGDTQNGLGRRFRSDSIEICNRLYKSLFEFVEEIKNVSEDSVKKLNKKYINEMITCSKNMILHDKRKEKRRLLIDQLKKTMLYGIVEGMYHNGELPGPLYKSVLNNHILISKLLLKLYKIW